MQKYHEQVQLLVSVLPHITKEECFALKGGTAINLFVRDMPRLSIDIDLQLSMIFSHRYAFKIPLTSVSFSSVFFIVFKPDIDFRSPVFSLINNQLLFISHCLFSVITNNISSHRAATNIPIAFFR
jgi:hypothetical protein